MERGRKRLVTLVRECESLAEILDQLDYEHYFRGLMRVLSDESLSHLVRNDAALTQITDYTRDKLGIGISSNGSAPLTNSPSSSAPVPVSNSFIGAKDWKSLILSFRSTGGATPEFVLPFRRSGIDCTDFI